MLRLHIVAKRQKVDRRGRWVREGGRSAEGSPCPLRPVTGVSGARTNGGVQDVLGDGDGPGVAIGPVNSAS